MPPPPGLQIHSNRLGQIGLIIHKKRLIAQLYKVKVSKFLEDCYVS